MTGFPNFDPLPSKRETPKEPTAENTSSDTPLSSHELPQPSLSEEYLLGADTQRICEVVEQCLGDAEFLNQFSTNCYTLYVNGGNQFDSFSDRLCQALVISLDRCRERGFGEQYDSLHKLSSLVEFFYCLIEERSPAPIPSALDHLVLACIDIAQNLAQDRKRFKFTESSEYRAPDELLLDSIAWGHVYAQALEHISRGLSRGDRQQNAELLEKIQQLLEMQFALRHEGLGPIQSNHYGVILIWQKTFLLAERLGDSRFSDSILDLAKEFVERSLSEEPGVVIFETDSDDDAQVKLTVSESLEMCERAALHALAKCQDNLQPVSLWKRILDDGSVLSGAWCLALVALADIDLSETSEYLVQFLNRIGRRGGILFARPQNSELMHDTLMKYLEKTGTAEILQQAFDPSTEPCVQLTRHKRVLSIFRMLLASPREEWDSLALKRLQYVVDGFENEGRK
jgi:hypothetical protein